MNIFRFISIFECKAHHLPTAQYNINGVLKSLCDECLCELGVCCEKQLEDEE